LLTAALLIFIGFLSHLVLSLVGGGGGLIGVILLVYLAQISIHDAIFTSLVTTVITCSIYVYNNLKNKLIIWNYAIPIAAIGICAAPMGAKYGLTLDKKVLLIVYSILMLVSSYLVWRNTKKLLPESEIKKVRHYKYIVMVIVAIISSFLSGMAGVGGGIIIVPFLVLFMKTNMRAATATSIFAILIFASTGSVSYIMLNKNFVLTYALSYSIGGILGIATGSTVAKLASDTTLKKTFSVVFFIMGLSLILQNLIL